jgi:hypothetical protein
MVKVAATEELAGQRLRHCTVVFKRPLEDYRVLEVPGIFRVRADSKTVHFDFRGDMGVLLRALAGQPVDDFIAEPESLSEAFFEVYEEGPA